MNAAAPYWTYRDLATAFGCSPDRMKRQMGDFSRRGFPAPLPWSLRQKRWNPDAVLAWKMREERRAQALGPPEFKVVAAARA
ncbi:MAG: hypothetical protein KGL46_14395 [Hyphomicrobiales bacterium]|nr:hypothetical protein [Hyphomicrobiales bacterium]